MKKILTLLAVCLCSLIVTAQELGIHFQKLSWAEAVKKAKAENKLIFVDFYTQWCGPCMNMAKQVFVLPNVGHYYNQTFVNLKIDAENVDGIGLAKKYGVRSYPTYAYIDPTTEEMVHRSGSRQSAEQFIQTGKDANIPNKRSFYLQQQYNKGNRERSFLIDYILYNHSIYARANVQTAFNELLSGGAKLTETDIWSTYEKCILGMNSYLKQVSDEYNQFCQLFGKKNVDEKLKKETAYGNIDEIKALCDFEGKKFNCKMIEIENQLRSKNYPKAIEMIDAMIADSSVNQQDLINRLKFIARVSYNADKMPDEWFYKCIEYLRYIAYNQKDRDDAYIHQEYAAALELLIQRVHTGNEIPPFILQAPTSGKTIYNMRPDELKAKPKKK